MEERNGVENQRLHSLDALRGFDMFWIAGGAGIFVALANLTDWPVLVWWKSQLTHVAWHGFRFEDMIFPLFLFIAGVSFPFSVAKRYRGPENRLALYRHIVARGLILVLLGIIAGNGVRFNFGELRYGSVLGHIGLAWMFAALIFINCRIRTCVAWLVGILVGYWLLLRLTHAPDLGATDPFSMDGSIVGYVDRHLLPGKLYKGIHDPEGILSTVPAIATALLGMLTGHFVRLRQRTDIVPSDTVLRMVLFAVGLILTGLAWNLVFPINKNLWTSSFVCFVGGLSLLLFALFYLVIDVWKVERWSRFFVVIGMNSITIYLAPKVIDFNKPVQFLFAGLIELFPKAWGALLSSTAYVAVVWLFLYFLYRKKIFLKI